MALSLSAAPAAVAAVAPAASAQAAIRPAFDVVSVDPGGETVVAGRAAPNVRVALLDGARRLGEATADARGQFVIIPDPLPPGDHSLVLSTGAGGATERSNPATVSVASPPPLRSAASSPGPAPGATTAAARAGAPEVAIRSVEANAEGGLKADGAAASNAAVRLYVSGAFVGDARTAKDGRWSLTIERGISPGAYVIRADQIAPGEARVVARAEAPFTVPALAPQTAARPASPAPAPVRSPADVVVESVQTHHVGPGHTLWGISQKFYGDGSRYAVIFSANSEQIRNPNLIYPGQTFLVPSREAKP